MPEPDTLLLLLVIIGVSILAGATSGLVVSFAVCP
jgi:hypothetical protein